MASLTFGGCLKERARGVLASDAPNPDRAYDRSCHGVIVRSAYSPAASAELEQRTRTIEL